MLIKLDLSSEIPIYQQIRNQILLGLACGKLDYGEDLPSARVLADALGVNFMTVNKAYNLLKEDGIIEADRSRGTRLRTSIGKELGEEYYYRLKILLAEGLLKIGDSRDLERNIEKIIREIKEGK